MKIAAAVHEADKIITSNGTLDLKDRKKKFSGTRYLTLNLNFSHLDLTEDDEVLATKTAPVEAILSCKGKTARFTDPRDSWGAKHLESLADVQNFINDATDLLSTYGIEFKTSASGTVATLVQDQVPQLKQLKPRWRQLAREAIFGGPCAFVAGSCPNAVSIDLSAAYLHGLRLPLPMPDSYIPVGPWDLWEHVQEREGFLRAVVDVPDVGWRSVGLLPVKAGPKTYFPCGRIVGSWPISLIRQAVELGASVVQIIEGATYTGYPYLAPLADLLEHLKNHSPLGKTLAKALYTRAWGILSSRGRYSGTIKNDKNSVKMDHTPTLTFKTTTNIQEDPHTFKVGPTYRPDWAAVIATYCTLKMQKATFELQGALIAMHVDSIAFTLDETTQPLLDQYLKDGWHHVEGPAPARWFGVGLAVHGTRILHKGIEGQPTPEEVEEYAFSHPDPQDGFRWVNRYAKEAEARPARFSLATPTLLEAALTSFDNQLRTSIWSDRWSKSGWQKESFKNTLLGPQPQDWLDIVQRLSPILPVEPVQEWAMVQAPPPEDFDIEEFLVKHDQARNDQAAKEQAAKEQWLKDTDLPEDFLDQIGPPLYEIDYVKTLLLGSTNPPSFLYWRAACQAIKDRLGDEIIDAFIRGYDRRKVEEQVEQTRHEAEWQDFLNEMERTKYVQCEVSTIDHLRIRSSVSIIELEQPMENPYNVQDRSAWNRSTPQHDLFDGPVSPADLASRLESEHETWWFDHDLVQEGR